LRRKKNQYRRYLQDYHVATPGCTRHEERRGGHARERGKMADKMRKMFSFSGKRLLTFKTTVSWEGGLRLSGRKVEKTRIEEGGQVLAIKESSLLASLHELPDSESSVFIP